MREGVYNGAHTPRVKLCDKWTKRDLTHTSIWMRKAQVRTPFLDFIAWSCLINDAPKNRRRFSFQSRSFPTRDRERAGSCEACPLGLGIRYPACLWDKFPFDGKLFFGERKIDELIEALSRQDVRRRIINITEASWLYNVIIKYRG
jgi:hypothetical protein